MLLIVKILSAAMVIAFVVLLGIGLHAFAGRVKRSWSGQEAPARAGLRLLMVLACVMFALPFSLIISRWAQTGGLDILSVEIILMAGPLAAGLAYALASGKREDRT
jgi:hypothetical protein